MRMRTYTQKALLKFAYCSLLILTVIYKDRSLKYGLEELGAGQTLQIKKKKKRCVHVFQLTLADVVYSKHWKYLSNVFNTIVDFYYYFSITF